MTPSRMKALVYVAPHELELREVPVPVPAEGEVLVKIEASGICGSDMHAYHGTDARRPPPLVLGHEAAGYALSGRLSGKRVTINPLVTCGHCGACLSGRTNICADRQIISMPPREGAFAEYIAIPERNLFVLPDDFPFEKAALTEPLACGWHGIRLGQRALGGSLAGMRCAVIGGGAIGMGAALVLRAYGAGQISVFEPNDERRAVLAKNGFETDGAPDRTRAGFELVVDAVGYEATRADASAIAVPGGVIVHIGLGQAAGGLDIRRMTLQEITFIGTYTYTADDFIETAKAITQGRLGALDWMDLRPMAAGPQAFADIHAGRAAAPKIMLQP